MKDASGTTESVKWLAHGHHTRDERHEAQAQTGATVGVIATAVGTGTGATHARAHDTRMQDRRTGRTRLAPLVRPGRSHPERKVMEAATDELFHRYRGQEDNVHS